MWCDTFDADLLKVVPGAAEALGEAAGMRLRTFSTLTDGKINCPSSWWTDAGLASFFWTAPADRAPAYLAGYSTDKPVAECTLLEAARDEWVHSAVVVVDGEAVWRPPARLFELLMYDLRGWAVLADHRREDIRERVRRSLSAAAERAPLAIAGVIRG